MGTTFGCLEGDSHKANTITGGCTYNESWVGGALCQVGDVLECVAGDRWSARCLLAARPPGC